jgi:putative two-component system hydrogenase maturation factor HypX/HoxX
MFLTTLLPKKRFVKIYYEEVNEVGYLHFDFYNGAMSTDQCKRLLAAFKKAKERTTKVIVLMGEKTRGAMVFT